MLRNGTTYRRPSKGDRPAVARGPQLWARVVQQRGNAVGSTFNVWIEPLDSNGGHVGSVGGSRGAMALSRVLTAAADGWHIRGQSIWHLLSPVRIAGPHCGDLCQTLTR